MLQGGQKGCFYWIDCSLHTESCRWPQDVDKKNTMKLNHIHPRGKQKYERLGQWVKLGHGMYFLKHDNIFSRNFLGNKPGLHTPLMVDKIAQDLQKGYLPLNQSNNIHT